MLDDCGNDWCINKNNNDATKHIHNFEISPYTNTTCFSITECDTTECIIGTYSTLFSIINDIEYSLYIRYHVQYDDGCKDSSCRMRGRRLWFISMGFSSYRPLYFAVHLNVGVISIS